MSHCLTTVYVTLSHRCLRRTVSPLFTSHCLTTVYVALSHHCLCRTVSPLFTSHCLTTVYVALCHHCLRRTVSPLFTSHCLTTVYVALSHHCLRRTVSPLFPADDDHVYVHHLYVLFTVQLYDYCSSYYWIQLSYFTWNSGHSFLQLIACAVVHSNSAITVQTCMYVLQCTLA
jgi:hypothetical protein